jgi:hypothetical protein
MVALLDSKPPTPEDLDRLRAMIDEAQRQSILNPNGREEETAEES